MTRHIHIGIVVLAAGIIATGCVSTGTFEKMEKAKNEEIAALKQEKTSLEEQKAALEKEKAALGNEKSALEQQSASLRDQTASLEKQRASMQKEVGSLEQEKAALLAASQQRQQEYEKLVHGLSKEVEKGQLQVRQYKSMLSVDLAEQIFFDSGKAALKKEGKEVLKKVGDALKGYEDKVIRVVGHTDNVPVAKSLQATFPSNWELSVARATNVVRFLQEVGIPPERMVPSGRGEYDPIASNDAAEGRQKNRRIEIMLIDKNLASELSRPGN
jgi:chemotaxis protein MotB